MSEQATDPIPDWEQRLRRDLVERRSEDSAALLRQFQSADRLAAKAQEAMAAAYRRDVETALQLWTSGTGQPSTFACIPQDNDIFVSDVADRVEAALDFDAPSAERVETHRDLLVHMSRVRGFGLAMMRAALQTNRLAPLYRDRTGATSIFPIHDSIRALMHDAATEEKFDPPTPSADDGPLDLLRRLNWQRKDEPDYQSYLHAIYMHSVTHDNGLLPEETYVLALDAAVAMMGVRDQLWDGAMRYYQREVAIHLLKAGGLAVTQRLDRARVSTSSNRELIDVIGEDLQRAVADPAFDRANAILRTRDLVLPAAAPPSVRLISPPSGRGV